MIELTEDELMAVVEELGKLPLREVHELVVVLLDKLQEHKHDNDPNRAIFTGE